MERLRSTYVQRWLIPLAAALGFFGLLVCVIPYSTSLWEKKLSLGRMILSLTELGPSGGVAPDFDFTYCLLVPVVFAYLVYLRWEDLNRAHIQGSDLGLVCIAFGLFVYWFGIRAEMQYFGYASIQILLAGVILWFWGWSVFRILFFPWAFFIFAWPMPFLDPIIAFPLRMVMSHLAAQILPWMSIACVQNGTAILSAPNPLTGLQLGARFQIDIADPCSGIRSLFALLMFSALFGYLFVPRLWQQWVIFLSAFPLAVVGNLIRVLMLVIGSLWFGSAFAIGTIQTPSWFHEACGFAIYGVALGAEFLLASLLTRAWKRPLWLSSSKGAAA